LLFNIKIHDESSDYEDIGSTMKCWVYTNSFNEAEIIIKQSINEYNWKLGDCIEKKKIPKEDYKDNIRDKEYLEKAEQLGSCGLIHTKPRKLNGIKAEYK
jgi:hypothetical protein